MVHGVILGAMPTHGSPAAYKRIRAGFEPGSFVNAARASVAEDMDTRDRESQNAIVRFFNDGYEGWRAIGSGAGARLAGGVSMRYLGATAEEVTALLANMPGGLQLLPNQFNQGPGGDRRWLKITCSSIGDIASLPSGDPYAEIYGRRDKWWRLTNPDMIDPGRSTAAAWVEFANRLAEVRDWNQRMHDAGGYHANTKMF